MIKAIKKAYEWLDKKTFIILNGDKLLKEREEHEIRISQFQNDIIIKHSMEELSKWACSSGG